MIIFHFIGMLTYSAREIKSKFGTENLVHEQIHEGDATQSTVSVVEHVISLVSGRLQAIKTILQVRTTAPVPLHSANENGSAKPRSLHCHIP